MDGWWYGPKLWTGAYQVNPVLGINQGVAHDFWFICSCSRKELRALPCVLGSPSRPRPLLEKPTDAWFGSACTVTTARENSPVHIYYVPSVRNSPQDASLPPRCIASTSVNVIAAWRLESFRGQTSLGALLSCRGGAARSCRIPHWCPWRCRPKGRQKKRIGPRWWLFWSSSSWILSSARIFLKMSSLYWDLPFNHNGWLRLQSGIQLSRAVIWHLIVSDRQLRCQCRKIAEEEKRARSSNSEDDHSPGRSPISS